MENQQVTNPNISISPETVAQQTNLLPTKTNLVMPILLTIVISGVLFGVAGFYFGKQVTKNSSGIKQDQIVPSPTIKNDQETQNVKLYKDTQNGITFEYTQNYAISPETDCGGVTNNKTGCLLSLSMNPTGSDYAPKANFWLLKGINSINISGQVSSITFDSQRKIWIVNNPVPTPEKLSIWDHTKSGNEIIKSTNGGSHGSSYYYIIPNYTSDTAAIFSIPQSYRLRCDNFIDNKAKETDCNSFYKSIISQYNNSEPTLDTWLPENYLSSIYSNAEDIVKSFSTTELSK